MGMSLRGPHCAMFVCIHICLLVATDQKFELNGLEGYVMVHLYVYSSISNFECT